MMYIRMNCLLERRGKHWTYRDREEGADLGRAEFREDGGRTFEQEREGQESFQGAKEKWKNDLG